MEQDLEGLSPRQKLFVLLYDGNATETAKRAGYKGSYNALAVTGHRLLKNPNVKAAIDKKHSEGGQGKTEILSRERKRSILAEIAENSTNPSRLRIDALNEDNKMTGQHKHTVEMTGRIEHISDRQLAQRITAAFGVLGVAVPKELGLPDVIEEQPEHLELEEGEGNKSTDNDG